MKTSYNKGAYRSNQGLYRRADHAYTQIIKENFFVSYAVRGPTFINEYGGVQYDMPIRGPQPENSTVHQPGPLSNQFEEYISDGSAVM